MLRCSIVLIKDIKSNFVLKKCVFARPFGAVKLLGEFRNFMFLQRTLRYAWETDPALFVLGLSVLALAKTRGLISLVKA